MTALLASFPLALDRREKPFHPPEDAKYWLVRKCTIGRPSLVRKRDNNPLLLPLHATLADLEEALAEALSEEFLAGPFRLYPADVKGNELEGKIAYIYIEPSGNTHTNTNAEVVERVIAMHERALEIQRDERNGYNVVMAETIRAMCEASTKLQDSASTMISAAAELARAPRLFDSSVFDQLLARMQTTETEDDQPWYVSVLNGPMGQMLAQVIMAIAQQAMTAPTQTAE